MKPFELEALRRLLFFSPPEAAAMVSGTSEQAWRRWEAGTRPVPDDVAVRMRRLADWRLTAIKAALDVISTAPADAAVVPVWYPSLDGWITLPGREAELWRPQQSVIAALMSLEPDRVTPVVFDGPAYAAWLAGREDTETMRSQWAAGLG